MNIEKLKSNLKKYSIISSIIIVVVLIIWYFVKIETDIHNQPITTVMGVVKEKIYVPTHHVVRSSYNSSTKRTTLYTDTIPAKYETYILILSRDKIIKRTSKDEYLRYSKGDTLRMDTKILGNHIRVIKLYQHINGSF